MNDFTLLPFALLILAMSFLLGLVRVFLGPSDADRMMSVQLVGTTAVALLVLLSQMLDVSAAIDVALVLSLLATVAVIALTRRQPRQVKPDD